MSRLHRRSRMVSRTNSSSSILVPTPLNASVSMSSRRGISRTASRNTGLSALSSSQQLGAPPPLPPSSSSALAASGSVRKKRKTKEMPAAAGGAGGGENDDLNKSAKKKAKVEVEPVQQQQQLQPSSSMRGKLARTASQIFESPRNAWRKSIGGRRASASAASAALPAEAKASGQFWGLTLDEMMDAQFAYFPRERMPVLIGECLAWLAEHGMREEGLFRRSCNEVQKLQMRKWLEKHPAEAARTVRSSPATADEMPHLWASVIKSLFQEMPESAFTDELIPTFVAAASGVPDALDDDHDDAPLEPLRDAVAQLPRLHYDVLATLFDFLHCFVANAAVHRMTAGNLATCFAPNFASRADAALVSNVWGYAGLEKVFEVLITHAPRVFDVVEQEQEEEAEAATVKKPAAKKKKKAAAAAAVDDAEETAATITILVAGNAQLSAVLNNVLKELRINRSLLSHQSTTTTAAPSVHRMGQEALFALTAPRDARSTRLSALLAKADVTPLYAWTTAAGGGVPFAAALPLLRQLDTLYVDTPDSRDGLAKKTLASLTDKELRALVAQQTNKTKKKSKRVYELRTPLLIATNCLFVGYNEFVWPQKLGL